MKRILYIALLAWALAISPALADTVMVLTPQGTAVPVDLAGTGSSNVADGTADNQLPVWDAATGQYSPEAGLTFDGNVLYLPGFTNGQGIKLRSTADIGSLTRGGGQDIELKSLTNSGGINLYPGIFSLVKVIKAGTVTDAVTNVLDISHRTSGTAGDGYGTSFTISGETALDAPTIFTTIAGSFLDEGFNTKQTVFTTGLYTLRLGASAPNDGGVKIANGPDNLCDITEDYTQFGASTDSPRIAHQAAASASVGYGLTQTRNSGLGGVSGAPEIIAANVNRYITTKKTLTEDTDTNLFELAIAEDSGGGMDVEYTIVATDGTTTEAHRGSLAVLAINANGTVTSTSAHLAANELDLPLGTGIADSWTVTNGTGKITVSLQATSGLTTPTITVYFTIINDSPGVTTLL